MGGVSTIFLGFGSQIVTTNFVSGIDLVTVRHQPCNRASAPCLLDIVFELLTSRRLFRQQPPVS